MKIGNLELKNFRNHASTFMVFDKLNFIFGRNNAGKSTIKQALEYALTGENEYIPGGKNAKEQIRFGEDSAFVEAEIEELGTLKRIIKVKGNEVELNSNRIPDKEVLKEIEDVFGVDYDTLSCVINSSKFINMSPNDQKDFLFRLSGAKLDPDKVLDFMKNPSDKAKEVVKERLSQSSISIETFDNLYKEFYATRKQVKKNRDALKAKREALGTVPDTSGVDIAGVNQKLNELTNEREKLLSQIAVAEEQKKQKGRLNDELAKINDRIAQIEKEIDPNCQVAEAEETIFGYVSEINEAQKEKEKHLVAQNVLESQTQSLKGILGKLDTDVCPLSDKLVCKTDKSVLTNDLKKQIAANEKEIAVHQKAVLECTQKITDLTQKKEHLEKQVQLNVELDTLKERQKTIVDQVAAIVIPDTQALINRKAEIEEYIKNLQDDINTHNNWVNNKKQADELDKELKEAEAEVELYEYLVEEFSPKGLKSRILQKIILPIENYCNQILAKLTDGYTLGFMFDDGFDIIVKNINGVIKLNSLSTSEKLRVGIVFQDAINQLTGARLLFIDDAEILDEENMKLLLELIGQIQDNYDSIFVIATADDKSYCKNIVQGLPNTKVFFVEDGNVQEL